MSTFFFALLATVALALCAVRPDSPNAKTRHQMASSLRALGLLRVLGLAFTAIAGVLVLLPITPLRIGLHGLLVAVAGGASWAAARIALKRHYLPRQPLELWS